MFQARLYRRGGPEVVTAAERRPFATGLAGVKTASWNGPRSASELTPYAEGTRAVAQELVGESACTGLGGGDTTAPVCPLSCPGSMSGGLSTGCNASLEYLQGKPLPGLAVPRAACSFNWWCCQLVVLRHGERDGMRPVGQGPGRPAPAVLV